MSARRYPVSASVAATPGVQARFDVSVTRGENAPALCFASGATNFPWARAAVYLISGAGIAAENTRSKAARSALGKSETAT
jgi:hypothetical protein